MMPILRRAAATAMLAATILMGGFHQVSAFPNPGCPDQHNIERPIVKLGLERLLNEPEFLALVKGKRVGLITNPTGTDSKLRSTIDLLHEHPDITLAKLYGPEHGVRGDIYAGDKVENDVDTKTGVPMVSLYGKKPSIEEFLGGIDVMIYDIQDVGSRSYTYIYTMSYGMEVCAEGKIPFIVLDRPNPCGADLVSGNVLNMEEGTSGVGKYAIPYMYGMTPGETAKLFNDNFLKAKCDLTVIPMTGYKREMLQWDTGLPFVISSPNVPHAESAMYYNLTGILGELNEISIGVGYPLAFEVIIAPWIDGEKFAAELTKANIPGLMVRPITVKPMASKFQGETCRGVQFFISDYRKIKPVEAQIKMMEILQRIHPEQNLFAEENKRRDMFDKVMGTKSIRRRLHAGESAEAIIADYQPRLAEFMTLREKYLIYPRSTAAPAQ